MRIPWPTDGGPILVQHGFEYLQARRDDQLLELGLRINEDIDQRQAELAALNPSARYVVTVELQGFQASRQEDFLVRAGQTASTAVTLTVGNVTDTVVVTAASPVVGTLERFSKSSSTR